MTAAEKNKIIDNILELLIQLTSEETVVVTDDSKSNNAFNDNQNEQTELTEFLTIKECVESFKGLKEYTIRQLITQNKISHLRNRTGKGSKILIPKKALENYLNGK